MSLGGDFDPRKLGARCDACVLQKCRPVPPERNPEATFAVIGDYPSDDDERNGVLYSGAAGKLLMRAFRAALTDRKHMHLTNTLLCRPPAGDLTKVLAIITKENQARDARNRKLRQQYEQLRKSQPWLEEPKYEEPILTPQECCAPRLAAEVQRFTQFVSLGAIALRFVGNTKASVMAIRGGMTELAETDLLPERRLMPTVHPSFVLHAGRYLRVFFSDIERAVRWFRGGLKWEKTQITYHPTAETLRAFLSAPADYFTFDLETDGIEPLTANIRCVGIWRPDNQAVVVGTLGKDGARQFYTGSELERVKRVLIDFFENEKIVKVAHNSPYDNTVLLQQWKTKAVPVIDTILLHRLVESELPHNLGFVGSLYTDAPSWKCYDGETEVLTPEGWVRFPALQRGVPVAQWDNGVVSFVLPNAYVDQEYTGTVWELTHACVDLVVTPGHKMVYRRDDGPKFRTCAVENLPKHGEMPNTGRLDNPGCLLSEEEIRLLVAVQAAGTWEKNGEEISALITAAQMRKMDRVRRFIMKRRIPSATISDKAVRLTPSATLFFIHRFLGDKKEFGPWIFSLSLMQRAWLLEEFNQWHKKMPADKTTLDWIQACAAVSNWETPGLPLARLYPSLSSITRKEVPFTGRIYCVSVPSGLLLVRRNGKVVVSGNTDREGRKIAFDAETDEQLHEYCALDCQVTGQVLPRLLSSVQIRNQSQLIPIDHAVQRACLDMHRVGFWINQEKRAKAEKKYIEIVTKTMGDLRKICGIPDYNPGSPIQTRGILFGTWRLVAPLKEEERYTESGLESINDFVLRALLTTRLTDQQRTFIMTLRRYRKAMKLLGTYIVKLRYSNQPADIGWDDDEEAEDRELRIEMKERYGIERMGIVDVRTGRMYPGFSAHVPVTGRLASSKPINCFDSSTEVLTERGWMAFDQLERGIRLAQWDDRTDEISWAVPTAYHERDYTGDMVLFENTSASLFCTPEHRIPLQKTSKRRITVEASFLLNPPAGHQTMHAGHCGWGAGLDLSRAELQFMLAWQADGSEVMTGGSVFGVDFTFTKERKAERLHSILTDMGVPFTYTKRDHKHRFYVSRCATTDKIRDMLGVTESGQRTHKTFGPWLLNMSSDQAQVFREEIWHWDGCLGEKSQYASTQKCNADWVQIVLTFSGVRANVRLYTNSEGNSVYVVDTKWSAVNAVTPRALRERVPFSGKVYCVTMPKDSIIIRRKGKVMITRQCQNFPKFLRALAEPFAGHCYIGADADQLELRIAAALWGATKYLRAFDAGADPHSTTAYGIFGDRFKTATGFPGGRWDGDLFIPDGTGKWSGDAKNYRDLAKKVQYACVVADTMVVTTDGSGVKAIKDLTPEDTLWCWSLSRNRYEPTKVVRAWKTGTRRVVRVKMRWWAGARGGWKESELVSTPDHLFLLRDGNYRAAGNLQPGDRLMPFTHSDANEQMKNSTPPNLRVAPSRAAVRSTDEVHEQMLVMREKLSTLTDAEISALVGCSLSDVMQIRSDLGIVGTPKKMNTQEIDPLMQDCVCLVEDAGEEEVWDVEVDHEDHNFAVEAGVFIHNSQYKANVDTVHRVIAQTEVENPDGTTSLPFLNLPLSDVRQMHQAWLSAVPEFERGWEREINEWRVQGYLEEPVSGRRRDFLDGENPNELVNFKVQGAAASLMNKAMIALHAEYHAHCFGYGTGLNSQVHDAMTIEVPLDGASFVMNPEKPGDGHWDVPKGSIPWRCMNAVNEAMNQVHERLPGVKITAAADIGKSWKEVG